MVAEQQQQAKAEISDYGEVKRLQSPPGWILKTQETGAMSPRACKLFHPPEMENITINVFFRGYPVSEEAIKALKELLERKQATNAPQDLSEDEIRDLSHVFGRNTVGDNQYTNDGQKGNYDYHVFHMLSAQTINLRGRTVIQVTGTFQDEHGTPTTEYSGYLFQSSVVPDNIEEIFFQAPTRELYDKHLKDFEESLTSLQWRR